MGGQIVWLDAGGVDADEVGPRASALARLSAAGLSVPRAFVLGRTLFQRFAQIAMRLTPSPAGAVHVAKLPPEMQQEIALGLRKLGGSFAVRRSPLSGAPSHAWEDETGPIRSRGGRPERETYLNLTDVTDVGEAVRRIWGQGIGLIPASSPVAVIVQRFLLPQACAIVRRDGADPDLLHVQSSLGVGDLLSSGLVVPDRYTLRRSDGTIVVQNLGRKAQMSVARQDGGMVRVPVPADQTRKMALDEAQLVTLATVWRSAEQTLGSLRAMAAAFVGTRVWVMTALSALGIGHEMLLG